MAIKFSPQLLQAIQGFGNDIAGGVQDVKDFLGAPVNSPQFQNSQINQLGQRAISTLRGAVQPVVDNVKAKTAGSVGSNFLSSLQPVAENIIPAAYPFTNTPTIGAKLTYRPDVLRQKLNERSANPKQAANNDILGMIGSIGPAGEAGALESSAVKQPSLFNKASLALRQKLAPLLDPFTENSKVIGAQGPSGKALATLIKDTYGNAEVQAGKAINTVVQPLKKFTQEEAQNFVDVAEGKAQPLNQKVADIYNQFDQIRSDIASKAKEAGLLKQGERQNYFPRVANTDYLMNPKNDKVIIQHLIDTGQADTELQATNMLNDIRQNPNPINFNSDLKKQSNLDYSRTLDLPTDAYEKDPVKALTKYFTQTYKRIGESTAFGTNGEKLGQVYGNIIKEGGNINTVQKIMEQITNPQQTPMTGMRQFLTNLQSARKLTTSAISNAGQVTNTITTKGLANTIHAYHDVIFNTDQALEKAITSGSLNDDLAREATNGSARNWVSRLPWIKAFGKVEDLNRIVEANASEYAVNSMVNRLIKNPESKLARRILQKQFNVNPDEVLANGGLTGDALKRAVNEGVNTSQFRTRAQDLPYTLSNPDYKLFTQFKSFAFKHAQFIMDHVVGEAAKGNVLPLMRYIAAGAVVGEGVSDAKQGLRNAVSYIKGQDVQPRPTGLARVADNIASAGGAGIISDAAQQILKGKTSVYAWLFGPTVQDAVNTVVNTSNAIQGKPAALERQALREVPVVGGDVANQLVPTNSGGGGAPSSSGGVIHHGSSRAIPKVIRH